MIVVDAGHYLDLPETTPAPARRLAAALFAIIRAGSAGDVGQPWTTTLPCGRRPGRRPCPGRIVVHLPAPTASIGWRCNQCGDQGQISNWANGPYDLRRTRLVAVEPAVTVVVPAIVATALRGVLLLDLELERVVHGMRADGQGASVTGTREALEDLLEALAAEANHEPNRRRQRALDAAVDTLERALDAAGVTS